MTAFDAWLTHNPLDDLPEPSEEHYERARAELGPDASEEAISIRADELREKDWQDSLADEAESRADDRDYYEGRY